MGLSGAQGILQRLMNHYLQKFLGDFVLCYLDDTLIYSHTDKEHPVHICLVLEVLQENKVHAKGSMCEFMLPSVTFQRECGQGEFQRGGSQEVAYPKESV